MNEAEKQPQNPFERFTRFLKSEPNKSGEKNKSQDLSTIVSKVTNFATFKIAHALSLISNYENSTHSEQYYITVIKEHEYWTLGRWHKIHEWLTEMKLPMENRITFLKNFDKLENILTYFFQANLDLINLRLRSQQSNSTDKINSIVENIDKIMSSFNEAGNPEIKYLLTALLVDRMFLYWPYIIDPDKNYQTEADAILKALGVDCSSEETRQKQVNKLSLETVIEKILTGELPMPKRKELSSDQVKSLMGLPTGSQTAINPD